MNKKTSPEQAVSLIEILNYRFDKNKALYNDLEWNDVETKLKKFPSKLWSLNEMEITGGEPALISVDKKTGEYVFYDFAVESPKGRRSLCYDHEALEARKENKPKDSAIQMAEYMGIEMLSEFDYRFLQGFGKLDGKTSSWVQTPPDIRKLGGAIFCDYRYGKVFTYHNGAESYYAARGFRGKLRL